MYVVIVYISSSTVGQPYLNSKCDLHSLRTGSSSWNWDHTKQIHIT